jgi:hypothetical protein
MKTTNSSSSRPRCLSTETRALVAIILLATACSVDARSSTGGPPAPTPGPAAPNEGTITGQLLDVTIIDSSSVGIAPSQPLCVLTVRLFSVSAVSGVPNAVNATAGQTIRAYSKDVSLAALKGHTVTGDLTFSGDERGGRLWIRNVSAVGERR